MATTNHRASQAGRPREFDITDAIQDAMNVFWTRGYHATSLPELLTGTGLSRGSLYKAFGDKRALFLRALDHYIDAALQRLSDSLATQGSAKAAIRAAVERHVPLSSGEAGRRGCLVVATATEMLPHDPEIATRIERMLRRIQDLFAGAILRGQTDGEIPSDRDEHDLARFLVCQIEGMRILGKAGATRRDMASIVDTAMRCLD
ncbi:TetR/AcrR family transcriptional regulator [Acidisphaera sp. L21]|uniref:TetR/AcrR family transcriptional regulator n=1 Tax=Acidisphaera sp. L21 TaxID=1641851 RepID=UPI001C201AD0|nr:TetR/AcrR family transcriptional regulator [Acidisphaera sp. L21]